MGTFSSPLRRPSSPAQVGVFKTPLRLEDTDGRRWVVLEPLVYVSDGGASITVPAGFTTDLASVPRVFWRIIAPSGTYNEAGVLHDFLYQYPDGLSRESCDQLFLDAMDSLGVNWFTRHTLHRAVRLGGWLPWRRYRSALDP